MQDKGIVHIGGSMIQHRELLFDNYSDFVAMIPGDHHVPLVAIERAITTSEDTNCDVTTLATNTLAYHETYNYSLTDSGHLIYNRKAESIIASLGTYIFKTSWLKRRLEAINKVGTTYCDLTSDVVFDSSSASRAFSPLEDLEYWQDVGTIQRLCRHIIYMNSNNKDRDGNITLNENFDTAMLKECIIYPDAEPTRAQLNKKIIASDFIGSYS